MTCNISAIRVCIWLRAHMQMRCYIIRLTRFLYENLSLIIFLKQRSRFKSAIKKSILGLKKL
mgnify:CR=1 FL=1